MKKIATALAAAACLSACGGNAQATPPAVKFHRKAATIMVAHVPTMRYADRACDAAYRGEYGRRLRGIDQVEFRVRGSHGRDLTCMLPS